MSRNRYDIDETLEAPFNIKHLKRAGVYIKKHAKAMIVSLFLSTLSIIFTLFGPFIMQIAIDNSVPNKDFKELAWLSMLLLITIIVSVLFSTYRSKIMTRVGQDIIYDIRKDLFDHMQKLSFEYYDDRPHGKILTRVVHYVNNVSDSLSNGIINFILEIFNLIFIMIFMFFTDYKLTLVILAGVPIFLIIGFILKPIQRKAWQNVSNKSSNVNAYIHENIDGAKINQIFTRQSENNKIFDKLNTKFKNSWMRAQYSSQLVIFFVDNISVIVIGAMYIVGVFGSGEIVSFGVILAMGNYSWRFWQPILNLSNLYNSFINSISYLERIFEMLDEKIIVDDLEDAIIMPKIEGNIKFEDVTFSYDQSKIILKNVTMNINKGESIALVGPTGAGKTTIVNLISRFYNIDSGKIEIDGVDISKVTLNSLRSQMGIMLQDSFIFSGTIYDNIKYGNLDATDQMVIDACKIVCADEFIEELENGYETYVSEKGAGFSSGQRQLISFARTLVSDPKILILDEATSTIDVKTEKIVQKALLELVKGRTCLIIAHRLSTIKNCDKILYISDCGIAESGTHDELIEKKGNYYKLYMSQS